MLGACGLSSLACVLPVPASARGYPSCRRSRHPHPLQASARGAPLGPRAGIGGALVRSSSRQEATRVAFLAWTASLPDRAPTAIRSLSVGPLSFAPAVARAAAARAMWPASSGRLAQQCVARVRAAVRQPLRAARRCPAGRLANANAGWRFPPSAGLQTTLRSTRAQARATLAAMRSTLPPVSVRGASRCRRAARADSQWQAAHGLRLERTEQGTSWAAPEEWGRRSAGRAGPPGCAPRLDRAAAVPGLQTLPALLVAAHCALPVRQVYW